MSDLKLLPIDLLDDHPQNPRIWYRDDVIDTIVVNLGDDWPKKHALSVRPVDDRYQIVSGHTRKRAAIKRGITHVWCWVESMTDEEAYMELATSNAQGELSPLEIGIHCFRCETLAKGGRGKKGGLSAYAERVGKDPALITKYRQAAEVVTHSDKTIDLSQGFLDRAQHLAAIHALPKACWPACVEWLGKNTASVAVVQERVKKAKDFLDKPGIDDRWKKTYLPPNDCAARVFTGERPTLFPMLSNLAADVLESLADHQDLAEKWEAWLVQCAMEESWKIEKVQAKRVELDDIRRERDVSPPPETVSVLLADPPWKYDFAETSNRQIENQYPTATVDEICEHINASWAPQIADDCVLFLWATAPKLQEALKVLKAWGFEYKTHAVWDKEKIGMGYWFRGQHELLLVGTRGNQSPPAESSRVSSVFREARGKHSKKPVVVYEAIESMFPGVNRFEMYQRAPRAGWDGGGLEA